MLATPMVGAVSQTGVEFFQGASLFAVCQVLVGFNQALLRCDACGVTSRFDNLLQHALNVFCHEMIWVYLQPLSQLFFLAVFHYEAGR